MKICIVVLSAAFAASALAQPEKMFLWPEGKIPSVQAHQHVPYLLWHTPRELKTKAVAIVVSGGGYVGNCVEGFEVSPMRDYLLSKGMNVVTMLYRTPRPKGLEKHITAWQDAQRTVRIVRKLAGERGLNPDSIGFTGCSAGGHLTVLTAVSSMTRAYEPVDEIDSIPCNVNWAIPVYPAYLYADGRSGRALADEAELTRPLAPELAFDAATPPMCLFHGDIDDWPAMGSVRVYHRLRTMGVPAEVHVLALENHCYQQNPRSGTSAENWKDIAWAWLLSVNAVTGHPMVWKPEWESPLTLWSKQPLEERIVCDKQAWRLEDWGGSVLASLKDGKAFFKGEWSDLELDLEYSLGREAGGAVLVRGAVVGLRNDGDGMPSGAWNRLTVLAKGDRLRVTLNGKTIADGRPGGFAAADGSVGFKGAPGVRFRNIRIRRIEKEMAYSLADVPAEIVVRRRRNVPVRFSLEENGSTGYSWTAEWNPSECSVALNHRAPNAPTGVCGAAGRAEVSIVSRIYTPARVELSYRRPWEKGVKPFKSVKVIVYTVGESKSPFYQRDETNRRLAEECSRRGLVITDWHLHIRGGMTPELAKAREDDFIVRSSAMENHGREWEIYDNEKLRAFAAHSRAVNPKMPVGIQVNDRDWFRQIDAVTREKFDYILADTMIMGKLPSGRDNRLWMVREIPDAEAWMREYFAHTMRILDEPISILANPTYLPRPVADRYEELWTEQRMLAVIEKAKAKGVALEIQAESAFPSMKFLRLAKERGAKFSFGTNNFDPGPKDLSRWLEAIVGLDLRPQDVWSPQCVRE